MTDKYEYNKMPFISLWEASEMFSSKDDLLRALQDGILKAQGRYSTDQDMADIMHGITDTPEDGAPIFYPYKDISPYEWQSFKIDWKNSCIMTRGATNSGLTSLVVYEAIRIKKALLDQFIAQEINDDEKESDQIRCNQIHELMKTVYIEMYNEKGRTIKVREVWNRLKKDQKKYPIILQFDWDGKQPSSNAFTWRQVSGGIGVMNYRNFENQLGKIKKKEKLEG